MSAHRMNLLAVLGDTPRERFENLVRHIIAVPKDDARGGVARQPKRRKIIAPNLVVVLTALALLNVSCMTALDRSHRAQQKEQELAVKGIVAFVAGAPLRITAFSIIHDSIGTPGIELDIFNDSATAIRAYRIKAILMDDFGGGACLGGRSEQYLESQSQNLAPYDYNLWPARWYLYTCDRATHFGLTVTDVVMVDGTKWEAPIK